jgi:hypothetical protein
MWFTIPDGLAACNGSLDTRCVASHSNKLTINGEVSSARLNIPHCWQPENYPQTGFY